MPRLFLPLAFGLLLALCVGMFYPSWSSMVRVWLVSDTYSHGILIAPITAWLIWKERPKQILADQQWSWLGIFLLLGACAIYVVGVLVSARLLEHVAVVGMLIGLFPLVFGKQFSLYHKVAIAFLAFMVPAGEFLNPMLMEVTADATVWALQLSGIAVFREGLHFQLPTGRWSVVEACSGLRYVIAALVLSIMFSHLNFRSNKRKLIFIAFALIVSIIANYVRAYTVVLVGHLTSMKYGTGDDHIYYGWVFFGVVMFMVSWAGMRFADKPLEKAAEGGKSFLQSVEQVSFPSTGKLCALAVAALALLSTTAFTSRLQGQIPAHNLPEVMSKAAPVWRTKTTGFSPAFQGALASYSAVHPQRPGQEFTLMYYAAQGRNPKMINDTNTIVSYGDSRWSIAADAVLKDIPGMEAQTVGELQLFKGERRTLVWYWYTVGDVVYTSKTFAKLGTLRSISRGFGDQSSVATLSMEYTGSITNARAALAQSVKELLAASRSATTQ